MHKAKAVVVGCIDFRFRSFIDKYLHEQEFGDSYDLISVAGGSRDFIVPVEENLLRDSVEKAVIHLKNKKILRMLEDNQEKIRQAHKEGKDYIELMEMHKKLESVKMQISKMLGIDILK